jgi:hypothetical protein
MRGCILCLVVALAGAGCGATESPRAPEAVAADAKAAFERERTVRFSAWSEDADRPVRCDGASDYRRHREHVVCHFGEDRIETIFVGDVAYTRYDFAVGPLAPSDRWERASSDDAESGLPDPREIFDEIRRSAVTSERLGRERVRDVEATRYRYVTDPGVLDGGKGPSRVTVDIWVDDADLLLRARSRADDRRPPFVLEFFDYGEEVEIEPPPDDQVDDAPPPAPPTPCPGGATTPLRAGDVVRAFGRHGIEVESRADGCADEWVAAMVTNEDAGFAGKAEALLRCSVARDAEEAAPFAVEAEPPKGSLGWLSLANVSCTFFPLDEDGVPDTFFAAARRAFEELRRSLD